MNVNGVSGYSQLDAYKTYQPAPKTTETATEKAAEETGVIYEKSAQAAKYTPNTAVIDMLKADAAAQEESFRSMVQKAIAGQGNALATSDEFWRFLASGNFTVTEAAKEEAQKAISEDGYWGVKQTSERILDFAKALAGDDPEKLENMRAAFEKGYKQAEKTWGGELPDISKQTFDAVMKGFDELTGKTSTE
jgi:hypothetical protein